MHIAFVSHTHSNSHSHTSASPTQTHHLLCGCIHCRSWMSAWNEIEMLPEDESFFECLRVCERDREFVLVAPNLFNICEGGMKSGEIRGNKASRIVWWWTWITSICVMLWALSHLSSLEVRWLSKTLTSACSGILNECFLLLIITSSEADGIVASQCNIFFYSTAELSSW